MNCDKILRPFLRVLEMRDEVSGWGGEFHVGMLLNLRVNCFTTLITFFCIGQSPLETITNFCKKTLIPLVPGAIQTISLSMNRSVSLWWCQERDPFLQKRYSAAGQGTKNCGKSMHKAMELEL